ncbi:ABC transporter ATP-binding protein [Lentzea flaviverrucosa]|uniref:ATP-binding cassette, subfamily B n=1 Tax=Lentzea flaviverrucosa TaxID=200379 RepID=A0A1H9GH23_9PSEU|nr:ABC transporter ATP-binding protein [Lentzea flaviverrucosa]RDI34909.1 ATP-binding cassette subfamily B protein [Lentzea flaviverrucosa]SEQ49412.1 ATP-binding cassette, subfamily B [Lentzea flaviverrucosa]
MRDTWRAFVTTISFGFRAARWHAVFQILTEIALALTGPLIAYSAGTLVDAARDRDLDTALTAGFGIAAATGLLIVAQYYNAHCVFAVLERTQALSDRTLMRLLGGIGSLAPHENPKYLDQIQLLREERESLAEMTNATAGLISAFVGFGATALLLAQVHPALISLALLAFISLWITSRANDIAADAQEDTGEPERLRRHLFDIGTTAGAGKELRVFGLTRELVRRHHQVSDEVLDTRNAAAWRGAVLKSIDAVINAAGFFGAIALVVWLAVQGRATPGDVVLVVALTIEMAAVVASSVGYSGDFLWCLKQARRYVWLERFAASEVKRTEEPAAPPASLSHGIDLVDVTYRYPASERTVLDGVSLHLPAGSVVALVGENGAGKSTLVKLLCDFYQPDGGEIQVDGVDLRTIPSADWRTRLTGAFQDFVELQFAARETIGVADIGRIDDDAALYGALARAGATSVVDGLPRGLDTQLGRSWEGGVELSGGQWQKLALARGLLRTDPLLAVFDEPTAALDPQTEHALFERFAEAAREGKQRGTVTLLVSHRFSTVRMADLIVVLDGGRIREIGSHEHLMAHPDLYAELYDLQSSAYR